MVEFPRRRVLVLTYEYPPSAGGGVQRVAKLTRYLPEHGIDPIVLTSEPIPSRPRDDRLAEEVARVPVTRLPARHVGVAIAGAIAYPKRLLRGAASGGGSPRPPVPRSGDRPPLSTRLSRWVAFDDAALWSADAIREGTRLAEAEDCEAVFASGPPFSVLSAGAEIASSAGIPFVADMRDPWLESVSAYWPTKSHRRRAAKVAGEVMSAASLVVAVSEPIADEARSHGARVTRVIPNGFDSADLVPHDPDPSAPLTLAFMGTFYALTDPTVLLQAMDRAAREHPAAARTRLEVIGPDDVHAKATAERLGLTDRVTFHGCQPHDETIRRVARADAGVVLVNEGPGSKAVYTGKLFEYLGIGLPILALVPPEGVAAELVREASAGWVVSPGDVAGTAGTIVRLSQAKETGQLHVAPDESVIGTYDRRAQARAFAEVLQVVMRP